MTPDMKRLCRAVWKTEVDNRFTDHLGEDCLDDACDADRERYEAIVRAVLMELREVSEDAYWAAHEPFTWGASIDFDTDADPRRVIGAYLDHILAEPATT